MVVVVGYAELTARLNAWLAAVVKSSDILPSSMARVDASNNIPSSKVPRKTRPSSSGYISRRASMAARFCETTSPSLTTTFVSRITTFPPSIAAGIPADCSSPIMGPGGKSVGPFSTVISFGDFIPPLIGAGVLLELRSLNNLNELSFENTKPVSWSR